MHGVHCVHGFILYGIKFDLDHLLLSADKMRSPPPPKVNYCKFDPNAIQ